MASKSDILKRIQASKKGEPTFQDKNRLNTWKKAGQGSRDQKHGYERALRNMQRSAQQGHSFNKVDAEIVSSYVKETPEQLLKKSGDFVTLMSFIPVAGGAPSLARGALAVGSKLLRSGLTPAAKKAAEAAAKKTAAAAKKAADAAAKKSAAAAKRLAAKGAKAAAPTARAIGPAAKEAARAAKEALKKAAPAARTATEVVKKAAVPTTKEAAKRVVLPGKGAAQRAIGKLSGSTATKTAAKKALQTAQRKAQRARISARTKVLGDIAKSGVHTKGLARTADRAGKTAYNKVMRQHGKAATATRVARQAKKLRRGQIAGGAALAAVPATVATVQALRGDKKTEKKRVEPPRPKRKPARVTGIASALPEEQKLDISGPGSWSKEKKDVREQYPTKGTRRALKPLEGGVRYVNLPDWLGGGRIKMDTSDKAFNYEDSEHKKGGQIKKGVKKAKAKPRKAKAKTRKRAALRGHRAELRGG